MGDAGTQTLAAHFYAASNSNKETELKDPPESIKYLLPASNSNRLWVLDGRGERINHLLFIIRWVSSRNKSCLISVNMTQDYSSKCRGWDLCIETGGEQGCGGRRLGEDLCQEGCTGSWFWEQRERIAKVPHAPDLQNPAHDTSLGQTAPKSLMRSS